MPPNGARGEIAANLGGREVRLCVTLGALAALETHFGVSGFEALGDRLKGLGAGDLLVVAQALCVDEVDVAALPVTMAEAIRAVVAAFEAMNG